MTTLTNQISQAEFEALVMSELEDMELTPEQLAFITGGGFRSWSKKIIKKLGDWAERKYGDGDGVHEWEDYKDEIKDIILGGPWF
ncbi:hypothetical protein PMIT1303_01718 [Prochlorococcus sp. MIT 1303]|nr:hypothetical protein PMIT1303_01718 [Prochlorococcus sp. MIT 1303]